MIYCLNVDMSWMCITDDLSIKTTLFLFLFFLLYCCHAINTLFIATEEFEELCFDFGIELEEEVRYAFYDDHVSVHFRVVVDKFHIHFDLIYKNSAFMFTTKFVLFMDRLLKKKWQLKRSVLKRPRIFQLAFYTALTSQPTGNFTFQHMPLIHFYE